MHANHRLTWTRRQFVHRALAGSVALLGAACAPAAAPPVATAVPKPAAPATTAPAAPAAAAAATTAPPPPTSAPAAAAAQAAPKTTGPVEVNLWDYLNSSPSSDKVLNETIDAFQKQSSGITIKRTNVPLDQLDAKVKAAFGANQLPDLVLTSMSKMQAFGVAGILGDITDLVKASTLEKEIFEGIFSSYQWQGKFYGVPLYVNTLAIFYNKDLFQKAGVTGPPTTWDELRDTAKKLTGNGVYGMALSAPKSEEGSYQFLPWLWSAGGDLTALTSPEAMRAFQFYQDLVKDGSMSREVVNWTQQDVNRQFVAGSAAMMENGAFVIPNMKDAKFPWGVAALPKEQSSIDILGGEGLGFCANSKAREAAFQFLTWLHKPENYKPFVQGNNQLPDNKAVASDAVFSNDPILSVFTKALETARSRAYGPDYPQASSYLWTAVQAAIVGQPIPDITKQAAEQITPLVKK